MKVAIFYLRGVVCILLMTLCVGVYGNIIENKRQMIELEGKCETPKKKSLDFPVETYINSNMVTVTFFDAIENVTISIIGDAGIMESRTVSFTEFQTESFDVSQYAVGVYRIHITTVTGTDLHGIFSIDGL